MNKKQKKMLARIILAAVLVVVLSPLPIRGLPRLALYLLTYLVIGSDILKKAGRGILNRQVFDENFLMAVATVGAFALAIYTRSGDYTEAIAVMLFYQIGELFQSYAVGKSRKNISALMDIRPDYANIERDGRLEQVDPEEVAVGSVIVVQPGEKIPLDGQVIEGSSTLNTSALTGESLPREVQAGEAVISGCINMTGVLKLRTTKEFGESTVSRILDLVENASSRKSRSEDFISKFARFYTPAVCCAALALALLPPLGQMLFLGTAPAWGTWLYRALTFLVISCPCALVISIPLSFFAGLGGASREGVLIKGSNYLETLAQTCPPLYGVLVGSSAALRGDLLLIQTDSDLFRSLVSRDGNKTHLVNALRGVTGQVYRIGVKKSAAAVPGGAPAPEDPLAAFIRNSRELGVEVKVKE